MPPGSQRRLRINVSAAARDGVEAAVLLVLTRPEVIDVRALVTIAEVTTSIRTIAAEVEFDHEKADLDRPSIINCDGLHTITKASLTTFVGPVSEATMERVCSAVRYAFGCRGNVAVG